MLVAFFIILIHWVADFVLQTDNQAKGKSTSWKWLLSHTGTYSLVWLVIICFLFPADWDFYQRGLYSIYFAGITFVCHTITDYFTSRLNSRLWKEGKIHEFFVSIGFDQVLHYGQIFLTYHLLTN